MAGGKLSIVFAAVLVAVCAATVPSENEIHEVPNEAHKDFSIKGLMKCADAGGVTGIINCAAMRALKSLQSLSRKPVLEVIPGVSLNSDDLNIERVGKEIGDMELPADPEDKANKLCELLIDNAVRLISGRTLKVKIPEKAIESMSRALEEEGRRRKRKGSKFPSFMLGMGAKLMAIVPAILAALALLSTKALIIAKLALVLSVVVFFQYFASKGSSLLGSFGGGGGGFGGGHSIGTSYGTGVGSYGPPTWPTNSIGGSQYPYARSIDVADHSSSSAQDLAYSQVKPN